MFKRLLNLLNIHPDENQKWLLISLFFSGLLITYANPTITKAIISELPAQWIAFNAVASSIAGLLIGVLWKGKTRKVAIKSFLQLAIAESFAGFILAMYLCFIHYNVWVFAIASLVYSAFITIFVSKCIMAFKAKLWQDKEREIYDNNSSVVSGIVCVVGFSAALFFLPSLKVALFLWGCCCIIDDIGWIYVYWKNRETLRQIE